MDTATGSQDVTLGAIVHICYVKEMGQKRCSANLTLISVQFYICLLNFISTLAFLHNKILEVGTKMKFLTSIFDIEGLPAFI